MQTIELAWARALLKAAMQTQGRDFVYQNPDLEPSMELYAGCYNVPILDTDDDFTGHPADSPKRLTGCLIGTAMSLSGLIANMRDYRNGSVGVFSKYLDLNAHDYFRAAQVMQDRGHSWGIAFDVAEAEAERFLKVGQWRETEDVIRDAERALRQQKAGV